MCLTLKDFYHFWCKITIDVAVLVEVGHEEELSIYLAYKGCQAIFAALVKAFGASRPL